MPVKTCADPQSEIRNPHSLSGSFPKNKWIILLRCVEEPVYPGVQMKASLLMSLLSLQGLTVWPLLAQLWSGEGSSSLFPVPKERGQGLSQPHPGKWQRPSAVTQKRHQHRPKGEAAKQRASEQPIFTLSTLRRSA